MFKEPTTYIEIRDDKPYIAMTGYKVAVMGAMFAEGRASLEWMLEHYPNLTPAQVYAAAAYYSDNIETFLQCEIEANRLMLEVNVPGAQAAYDEAVARYERVKAGDWWIGQPETQGHD